MSCSETPSPCGKPSPQVTAQTVGKQQQLMDCLPGVYLFCPTGNEMNLQLPLTPPSPAGQRRGCPWQE